MIIESLWSPTWDIGVVGKDGSAVLFDGSYLFFKRAVKTVGCVLGGSAGCFSAKVAR